MLFAPFERILRFDSLSPSHVPFLNFFDGLIHAIFIIVSNSVYGKYTENSLCSIIAVDKARA